MDMSDDEHENNGGGIPEGVDFQKYAEDMLLQRLLAKEKQQQQQQQRDKSNGPGTMSGLTEDQLLFVAAFLCAVILACIGIVAFLYFTKKK